MALLFPGEALRREVFRALLKMALVAGLLYAPWFGFAWWYYGSPIPHTVIAKSAMGWGYEANMTLLERIVKAPIWMFDPICAMVGGWPDWLLRPTRAAGVAGFFLWALPLGGPLGNLGRRASFVYAVLVCYLDSVVGFFWYMPPAALCLSLALACAFYTAPRLAGLLLGAAYVGLVLQGEGRLIPGHRMQNVIALSLAALAITWRVPKRAAGLALTLVLLCTLGTIATLSTIQLRVQQQVVEWGNRRQIGEWLQSNAGPNQTIYLECLGYIGYFSNGRMLDYPGLVSPAVVKARKETGLEQIGLIPMLQPDWLVLRPNEYRAARTLDFVKRHYREIKVFDVGNRLEDSYSWLPGMGYLKCDSRFTVLRRVDSEIVHRADMAGN
jgi:hypothetical protein